MMALWLMKGIDLSNLNYYSFNLLFIQINIFMYL